MGKTLDFGRDPMPGSGTYRVTAAQGGRELGRVKADSVDAARSKAAREIPETARMAFVVTEIPLGEV